MDSKNPSGANTRAEVYDWIECIIFALVFSVMVGLVSGYQPANKAVKISALEAIRNE